MGNNLPGPRLLGDLIDERLKRYRALRDDPKFEDHERRATRVFAARDLNARFIALTGYYRCARREIECAPFEWGVDPRHSQWHQLMTPIEQDIWEALQARGLKFYPQYPIGRYFADFAHPAAKCVVECDGAAYHHNWTADANRDDQLAKRGWTVFHLNGRDCLHERPDTEDDPSPFWNFIRRIEAFVDQAKEGNE